MRCAAKVNSRTSRKSCCKTLSSLGILIASEMKWEGKRKGGGLEQGEMERDGSPLEVEPGENAVCLATVAQAEGSKT